MIKTDFTNAEKIACLRRELAMRRNVFQKRVDEGRMKPEARDREIGLMEAILADYNRIGEPPESNCPPHRLADILRREAVNSVFDVKTVITTCEALRLAAAHLDRLPPDPTPAPITLMGVPVVADPTLPPFVVEFRDSQGNTLKRFALEAEHSMPMPPPGATVHMRRP